MAFSEQTEKLVKELIQAEYINACEKFGDKYHSLHEGYAVLKEEIKETEEELDKTRTALDLLWESIRYEYLEIDAEQVIESGLESVISQMKELAQVGAVLMKIKNTFEVEE